MNTIDLDAIIEEVEKEDPYFEGDLPYSFAIECMKKVIHQALVLASEKAKAVNPVKGGMIQPAEVDKQSILDIEKLIK